MDDELKRILFLSGIEVKEVAKPKPLNETAPNAWEGTIKKMKKHKDIDNPYALANFMKDKGDHSHYTKSGKKKKKYEMRERIDVLEFLLAEDRLDYLEAKYAPLLKKKADETGVKVDVERLVGLDPTSNKAYTQWIIQKYLKSDFSFNATDTNKLHLYLTLFSKNKNSLPIKDINQIKSVADLFKLIDSNKPQVSKNELDRQFRSSIKQEIKVVYSGSEGKIYQPLSFPAMQFLGRGTQWCVSMSKASTFSRQYRHYNPNWDPEEEESAGKEYWDNYTDNGKTLDNLQVVICSDGEKFIFMRLGCELMNARLRSPDNEQFNKMKWAFDKVGMSPELKQEYYDEYGPKVNDEPSESVFSSGLCNEIMEDWDSDYEIPDSQKGKWDGWTKEELEKRQSELHKMKDRSAADTKELRQINFALRAKSDWGKAD